MEKIVEDFALQCGCQIQVGAEGFLRRAICRQCSAEEDLEGGLPPLPGLSGIRMKDALGEQSREDLAEKLGWALEDVDAACAGRFWFEVELQGALDWARACGVTLRSLFEGTLVAVETAEAETVSADDDRPHVSLEMSPHATVSSRVERIDAGEIVVTPTILRAISRDPVGYARNGRPSGVFEAITYAAICEHGAIYWMPRPARHHTIAREMKRNFGVVHHEPDGTNEGFLTSTWRYVDRFTASVIAMAAGQVRMSENPDENKPFRMTSEDLW